MEGVSSHGRPVWKNENSDTYLFYSSDSYWRVGYAYGGNAGGWIQSNEKGLEEIPSTNWNNGVTVEGLFVILMYLTTPSYLQVAQDAVCAISKEFPRTGQRFTRKLSETSKSVPN